MVRTILLACTSLFFVASIVRQPDEAFQASLQGLSIWWNLVFPGLLPFLVLAELMAAYGVVQALGVLLEPAMRRLFRLPGEAGFAVAAGWTMGSPAGAEATAALRRRAALSRDEGERLLALSHMPNPVFMLVVVGAGFLRRPELGLAAAAAVWGTALALAFAAAHVRGSRRKQAGPAAAETDAIAGRPRTENRRGGGTAGIPGRRSAPRRLLGRAARAMADSRRADGRSFGQALGDAVTGSVQKLMAVGGLIIVCAVAVRMLQDAFPAAWPFALPALLEGHIGAYAAASWDGPGGTAWTVALLAATLAWGGFGAILQASVSLAKSGLRLWPLVAARLVHAAAAFAAVMLLWRPAAAVWTLAGFGEIAAFASGTAAIPAAVRAGDLPSVWPFVPMLVALCGLALGLLALCSWPASRSRGR
ncbi:nucleoside recognition domain-containing protein [Paenibacillus sp. 32O-W]|nr:nucleoside recognition domain-containing protein [Paenibacillus sp. 32O-W]ALS27504.1 nucleoside recognition domain-containing protein [Paenibacillus sp. 32O-W]